MKWAGKHTHMFYESNFSEQQGAVASNEFQIITCGLKTTQPAAAKTCFKSNGRVIRTTNFFMWLLGRLTSDSYMFHF